MNSPTTRTRPEIEQYYGQQSFPRRVINRVRGSFLIMLSLFGVAVFLFGAAVSVGLDEQIWGPVLGAAGAVIAIIHIVLYFGYQFIEKRY